MSDVAGRTIVHLIEPQHLFVSVLIEVFTEAGLSVDHVASEIDPRRLLEDQPDLVFLDTDYIEQPLEAVRLSHVLAPRAKICVYTSARTDAITRAFVAAGADSVLEKAAERRAIVQNLRELDRAIHERFPGGA